MGKSELYCWENLVGHFGTHTFGSHTPSPLVLPCSCRNTPARALRCRTRILKGIAEVLNETVAKFRAHNPSVAAVPISMIGHSLGSVILYDLLILQTEADLDPALKLTFAPSALFLPGSPLGLFLIVRGVPPDGHRLLPPNLKLFNIFEANDPIAYRIEPLVVARAAHLAPKSVPHHVDGGVRPHVRVKNAMSQLWKVPGDLFSTDGQGLKRAWERATSALDTVAGRSIETEEQKAEREIEAELLVCQPQASALAAVAVSVCEWQNSHFSVGECGELIFTKGIVGEDL